MNRAGTTSILSGSGPPGPPLFSPPSGTFNYERDSFYREAYDLAEWIASDPSILGSNRVIIGRQVTTRSGSLDLLAIDRDGNLVIVELKRELLPRVALAQAVDYASDVASWSLEKVNETCSKYTGKSLDDVLTEAFPDVDIEAININGTQRILLVGFAIESALERMIGWLSDSYGVSINAIILNYIRTESGEELLTKTAIISEELEQERAKQKKRITIPRSDKPGEYEDEKLEKLILRYFAQDLYSARRIRDVLLPACLAKGTISRADLKDEFTDYYDDVDASLAGYFISLISTQIGFEKNDFLRQVIGYGYPNNEWEKDNYHIREGYQDLVRRVLDGLPTAEKGGSGVLDLPVVAPEVAPAISG